MDFSLQQETKNNIKLPSNQNRFGILLSPALIHHMNFSFVSMQKRTKILLTLIGLLPISICVAAGVGAYQILPWRIPEILFFREDGFAVLVHVRFPRVILSAAVGAMLAISGATLQGIFRNPLADPRVNRYHSRGRVRCDTLDCPNRWRCVRRMGTSYRCLRMWNTRDYQCLEDFRRTRKSSHTHTIIGRHCTQQFRWSRNRINDLPC